jgi:hypothetical protein
MSLQVNLLPYSTSVTLPKEGIQTFLPESLIGQALESEPEITSLDLNQPEATPEALHVVAEYLTGREPATANPNLASVAKYLNIPWLAYYADPFYDRLEKPVTDTLPNKLHLMDAITADNALMVNYLLQKGVIPSLDDLLQAVESSTLPVVAGLLASPHLNPSTVLNKALMEGKIDMAKLLLADKRTRLRSDSLNYAVDTGNLELVQSILAREDVDFSVDDPIDAAIQGDFLAIAYLLLADKRTKIHNEAFIDAIDTGDLKLVEAFLARDDVELNSDDISPIREAIGVNNVAVAQLLITDPRFDPSHDNYEAIKQAVYQNRPEILKLLLAHPEGSPEEIVGRVDDFQSWVYENPTDAAVQVLLADPRFSENNESWLNLDNVNMVKEDR